jgi:glycosyltransferase involved in cell wall biosynthesis
LNPSLLLWVAWIVLASTLALAVCLALVVVFQLAFACLGRRVVLQAQASTVLNRVARVVVLIPAHNEEHGIQATLASVTPQLGAFDRILVVADNCNDGTAQAALANGAQVIERQDLARRGKGFALQFGLDALRADPPDSILFLDADCVLSEGSLELLARTAEQSNRPVQALDLMTTTIPAGQVRPMGHGFAQFAWIIRNHVRPLGFHRLNLPCQMMGTGMLVSWAQLSSVALGTGHLAEDLRFGGSLALDGHLPLFVPDAKVTSLFPEQAKAVQEQATRWMHGHLDNLFSYAPGICWRALATRNFRLLAFALDMAVPPLASLILVLTGVTVLCFSIGYWTSFVPAFIGTGTLAVLAIALLLAWHRFGRAVLGLKDFLVLPGFVLRRAKIALGFAQAPETEWKRAQRPK